jgi:hypothetical protein
VKFFPFLNNFEFNFIRLALTPAAAKLLPENGFLSGQVAAKKPTKREWISGGKELFRFPFNN